MLPYELWSGVAHWLAADDRARFCMTCYEFAHALTGYTEQYRKYLELLPSAQLANAIKYNVLPWVLYFERTNSKIEALMHVLAAGNALPLSVDIGSHGAIVYA